MNKKYFTGILLMALMLIIAACGGDDGASTSNSNDNGVTNDEQSSTSSGDVPGVTDDTIVLGMLNDFSGGASFQGGGGADGYHAFVDYINEQGGINGRMIELISEDNQYTPAGGVNGAKKLVELDNVFAIPYSIGTGPTIAIKDYVNEEEVPVLGIGEGTEIFHPGTKYVFGVGTPYSYQGAIAVRYIAETLSKGEPAKLAFMGQDDAYGGDPLAGAEIAAENYDNTEFVFKESHARDAVDFSDQVLQLKNSGAEYLLISANVDRVGIIVKELAEQNVELKGIFSTSLASIDNRIFEVAGHDYIGKYYGIQSNYTWDQTEQESVSFVIDLLKEQGKEDVLEEKNTFFWYGWNNMAIIAKAIEMAGEDLTREGLIEALESFDGTVETLATLPEISYGPDKRMTGHQAFVTKAEVDSDGNIIWATETEFIDVPDAVKEKFGF